MSIFMFRQVENWLNFGQFYAAYINLFLLFKYKFQKNLSVKMSIFYKTFEYFSTQIILFPYRNFSLVKCLVLSQPFIF